MKRKTNFFKTIFLMMLIASLLIGCSSKSEDVSAGSDKQSTQATTEVSAEENTKSGTKTNTETTNETDNASDDISDKKIEITDVAGRKIILEKPAERIVDCTALGGTRVMIQLGNEDLLVGATDRIFKNLKSVDQFSKSYQMVGKAAPDLADNIVNVGDFNEPDIEKIISLNPDLILIGWGGKEQAETLEKETGIKTVCIGKMNGLFDRDLYRIVGKATGAEDRAEELIQYLEQTLSVITDVTDKMPDSEKKRIYFWIIPAVGNPPRSNGLYEAFDLAGAINVASTPDYKGLYETSLEQVAAWNPDYIFLQYRKEDNYYDLEKLKNDPILQNINAVKDDKVYNLRGPISDWDTAIEATEAVYIAKLLYPDKFADLDVKKLNNEILEKFYGVENLYDEMTVFSNLYTWK